MVLQCDDVKEEVMKQKKSNLLIFLDGIVVDGFVVRRGSGNEEGDDTNTNTRDHSEHQHQIPAIRYVGEQQSSEVRHQNAKGDGNLIIYQ